MSKESGVLTEGKGKCRSCQCYSKRGGARTLAKWVSYVNP